MSKKNFSVFFLALAVVLLSAGSIFAAAEVSSELASVESVKIDETLVRAGEFAVEAGSSVAVKVTFKALVDASDVKLKLELEGDKVVSETVSAPFDVEKGKKYSKTLTLEIPYELKDKVSSDLTLDMKIWNGDYRTEDNSITLRVQRPSYSVEIMSVDPVESAEAGKSLPVDVTLKNVGYNDLDDVYVTFRIAELGVEKTSYFGDLAALENDSRTKRFYLEMPSEAKAGSYTLEVEAHNADMSAICEKELDMGSAFSDYAFTAEPVKSAAAGSEARFEVVVVNPTDQLRVFKIVAKSGEGLEASVSEQLVAVPAGMTKTVVVSAKPEAEGEYELDVSVFEGEKLVDNLKLSVLASGKSASSDSVVTLSIILGVIFLVLLGTLIALLRKKPGQVEDFGESYY